MKTRCLNAIICLIGLVFFCILSCDNGSVSDSASSNTSGLVKVSLAVDNGSSEMQKSVSIHTINDVNYTYYYKAVPQWSQDTPIAGSTNNQFVLIPGYASGDNSLGYFSPGQWVFYVQVQIGGTPIYEGRTEVISINKLQQTNVITVPVARIIRNAISGGVSINIKAPTMDNTDKLTITWGNGQGESATVSGTADGGITTFTHEVDNLDPGTYTFTFSHNNVQVQAGAIAVDVRENEMVVITGQLDNGEWNLRATNVAVHTIKITSTGNGQVWQPVTTAVPGDWVVFSLNPVAGCGVSDFSIKCDGETFNDYITNNLQYGFRMPDGDITVIAEFSSAITIDDPQTLRAFITYLYGVSNKVATEIAPADNEKYTADKDTYKVFSLNGLKLWYNSSDTTIYYYSEGKVNLVGSCSSLFSSCLNVEYITLSNIDTTGVTDMSYMFGSDASVTPSVNNVHELKRIYLTNGTNFNTGIVTDMKHMFGLCYKLEPDALTFVSDFDTSSVTDMSYMFAGNTETYSMKINELDLSGWDFSSVQYVNHMFDRCMFLDEGLIFPDTTKFYSLISMNNMFSQCARLSTGTLQVIISNWKFLARPDDQQRYNDIYGDNDTSLFGRAQGNQNTSRNFIIRQEMLDPNKYGNLPDDGNFMERLPYRTKDGVDLYVGGSKKPANCCLTIKPTT